MKIDDLSTVVYTCTKNLHLLKIFKKYWLKNIRLEDKAYIVSNTFENYTEFDHDNFKYIDANIPFSAEATHFRDTLLFALDQIETKYIFFLLDDYIFMDANLDIVSDLVMYMKKFDVKLCSFASHEHWLMQPTSQKIPTQNIQYVLSDEYEIMGVMPSDYVYRYSVQPCIWEVETLKTILKNNPNLTLHTLDTAIVPNMDPIKSIITIKKTKPCEPHWAESKFALHYVEIIRHGYFNECEHSITVPLIRHIMNEFNITSDENSIYRQYITPNGLYW